jgi:hypothetical protein
MSPSFVKDKGVLPPDLRSKPDFPDDAPRQREAPFAHRDHKLAPLPTNRTGAYRQAVATAIERPAATLCHGPGALLAIKSDIECNMLFRVDSTFMPSESVIG